VCRGWNLLIRLLSSGNSNRSLSSRRSVLSDKDRRGRGKARIKWRRRKRSQRSRCRNWKRRSIQSRLSVQQNERERCRMSIVMSFGQCSCQSHSYTRNYIDLNDVCIPVNSNQADWSWDILYAYIPGYSRSGIQCSAS
jgi:hypothetical protein